MNPERIIEILNQLAAEQFNTASGTERVEALQKAVEVLKYVELVKVQLEKDLMRGMRNE
jgi:hypothetical protein